MTCSQRRVLGLYYSIMMVMMNSEFQRTWKGMFCVLT